MIDERRRALAADARAKLTAALDELLGERLVLTEKRPRDGAGWVDVGAHDMAVDCPARWSVPDDDFAISAATAAGAIGRLALRERGPGEPVPVAVARVLSGIGDAGADAWFAGWYLDELDRAGQAAVRAAATTWAIGALSAVGGRELAWAVRRQKVDVDDRMIRLSSNWDASTPGTRPEVLVVMTGRAPSDPAVELVAGFDALVDGLLRRQVPARVRVGSASMGTTVAFPVTAELLERVVDRIVDLVRWRVVPDDAPTRPGRWCSHCHLLEICPDAAVPGWSGQGTGSTTAAGAHVADVVTTGLQRAWTRVGNDTS